MLRRPSALCAIPREEGCSSTAIEASANFAEAVWSNPVHRGSASAKLAEASAVP
jgi:hypothetical protein